MKRSAYKAFYLFLCSILGMVLLVILQRAIFVLYELMLLIDYSAYSFGLSPAALMTIDFFSLLAALFLGGWYGTALGLDWYSLVYGPNAPHKAGWFHGFLPHNFRRRRHNKHSAISTEPAPVATSTVVTVPVTSQGWSFDDLVSPKAEAKRKLARKTAKKK
jgi:hypothetical protein